MGEVNWVLLHVLLVYIQNLLDLHLHLEMKIEGSLPVHCILCGLCIRQSFCDLKYRHLQSWATFSISTTS